MATDALRSQVASKWQESFNRLNQNTPGISGLMKFSEVSLLQIFYFFCVNALQAWSISTQFLYPRNIRLPLMVNYVLRWLPLESDRLVRKNNQIFVKRKTHLLLLANVGGCLCYWKTFLVGRFLNYNFLSCSSRQMM